MIIRRRIDQRAVVVEADVIEDRRLSPAAIGVYCYLAASPDDARPRSSILRRFSMSPAQLDTCLAELRESGHLADAPPPPRRSSRPPRARDTDGNRLSQSGRLLLHVLASKADPTGCAEPLNRELAADTGQHPRTIHRNLAALEAGGFLRREIAPDGQDGNARRRIYLVPDLPERTAPESIHTPGSTIQ